MILRKWVSVSPRGGARILQRGGGGGARCMLDHLRCTLGALHSQTILNFGVTWGGGGKPPKPPTGSATESFLYHVGQYFGLAYMSLDIHMYMNLILSTASDQIEQTNIAKQQRQRTPK